MLDEGGQAALSVELQNLAHQLSEDELTKLGGMVVEEFEEDNRSAQPWREMHAHWINLYYQQDKPLNPPWRGSSEESIPMLAEACNQFHARAFQAFFPNRSIIKTIPTGNIEEADLKRAERVGKHMSWQLLVRDKDYKSKKDALILSTAIHGSFFTKTYYDPFKARNMVENIRAEDLVVPYGVGPRAIEDLNRKTHIVWKTVNDTRILAQSGFFASEALPYQSHEGRPTTEAVDKATGIQPSGREEKYWACLLEQHRFLDLDGDGIEEPYIVTVDRQSRKILRLAIRYDTDDAGNPLNDKAPVEYFTHYGFLPNSDGFYALGMGHLIGKINTAVNKLLRQTIDAGTLVNNKSGFVSEALALRKGEVEMSMGKFIKVPNLGGKISDHIQELQFSGPDQTIAAMIELLVRRGDRLATVTEALTGQMEKVQQPTAILALIEQGLEVFSAVYERLWESWSCELRKIYRLNSRYLSDKEYITVLDIDGLERFAIQKKDYAEDLEVIPIADPRMTSDQARLTRATAEWQFLSTNPLTMQSPTHFYNASRRYLEAIETRGIDEVLPRPPEPGRIDDPQLENAGALMPMPVIPNVFPDQDHLAHMQAHEAFLKDPLYGARISPNGRAMLEMHIQKHLALLYGVTESMEGFDGAGSGGYHPMAAQPGNGMAPGAVGGTVPAGTGMAGGPGMGGDMPPPGAMPGA